MCPTKLTGASTRPSFAPPDAPDPAVLLGSGAAAAHLFGRVTAEVRA